MTKEASARFTFETLTLGKGVNRELSEDVANSVVRIFKSVILNVDDGKNPLEIPVTAATPSTEMSDVPTLVTLAIIGSPFNPGVVSLYWTKSFSLTRVPGKDAFELLMVLIPPESGLP